MPQKLGEKVLAIGWLILGCLGLVTGLVAFESGWPPARLSALAGGAVFILWGVSSQRDLRQKTRR